MLEYCVQVLPVLVGFISRGNDKATPRAARLVASYLEFRVVEVEDGEGAEEFSLASITTHHHPRPPDVVLEDEGGHEVVEVLHDAERGLLLVALLVNREQLAGVEPGPQVVQRLAEFTEEPALHNESLGLLLHLTKNCVQFDVGDVVKLLGNFDLTLHGEHFDNARVQHLKKRKWVRIKLINGYLTLYLKFRTGFDVPFVPRLEMVFEMTPFTLTHKHCRCFWSVFGFYVSVQSLPNLGLVVALRTEVDSSTTLPSDTFPELHLK